eukprot:Polyplicarium_translucidae@DN1047_c0_g1_i3.p1
MSEFAALSTSGLAEDLSCPICMGTFKDAVVVKDKWLRGGHQDCPQCRQKIPSRRSLRKDLIFRQMIARLFPDVEKFESVNDELLEKVNKRKSMGCVDRTDFAVSLPGAGRRRSRHPGSQTPSAASPMQSEALRMESQDFTPATDMAAESQAEQVYHDIPTPTPPPEEQMPTVAEILHPAPRHSPPLSALGLPRALALELIFGSMFSARRQVGERCLMRSRPWLQPRPCANIGTCACIGTYACIGTCACIGRRFLQRLLLESSTSFEDVALLIRTTALEQPSPPETCLVFRAALPPQGGREVDLLALEWRAPPSQRGVGIGAVRDCMVAEQASQKMTPAGIEPVHCLVVLIATDEEAAQLPPARPTRCPNVTCACCRGAGAADLGPSPHVLCVD